MISVPWIPVLLAGILPTIALLGVFVRLGSFVETVKTLKDDTNTMSTVIESLRSVVTELQAWRDASKMNQEDLLARVRRLEDRALRGD
jgi:hypothetical protein